MDAPYSVSQRMSPDGRSPGAGPHLLTSSRVVISYLRGDSLPAYALRRLLLTVPIVLGVTLLVFALLTVSPGSPVANLLGPAATEVQRQALERSLGLDRPLFVRYFLWLAKVVVGNFGQSFSQEAPVRGLLISAIYNTLILAAFAAFVAIVGGVTLGFVWAKGRKAASHAASAVTTVAISAPQYAVALLFIVFIALHVSWLPTTGMYDAGDQGNLGNLARHIILPGVASSLVMMGIVARIFRASLLDVEAAPWLAIMRSRGVSRLRANLHAAFNTLPTVLSVIGIQFGYLIGGVLFVEIIFSWPGMGQQIYNAIAAKDYALVEADVLAGAAGFITVNLIVDIVVAVIDPRTRSRA